MSKNHTLPTVPLLIAFFIPCTFILLQRMQSPNYTRDHVIVIDVGHGGNDPGKISISGTKEKDINLIIAKQLKNILTKDGYTVFLTRESDTNLADTYATNQKRSDLSSRIRFIQEHKANLVISIHQNSFSDSSVHGSQVFYQKSNKQSECLALCLQNSLSKLDTTNKRLAKESDSLYLLKNSSVPTVLIECGFLSNPNEEALLTDADYQSKLALYIKNGIIDYIEFSKKYI